jgi:hypothetical protein
MRQPDRLREVDGIGPVRANRIATAWAEQKVVREIMVFLHSRGVGSARAVCFQNTVGLGVTSAGWTTLVATPLSANRTCALSSGIRDLGNHRSLSGKKQRASVTVQAIKAELHDRRTIRGSNSTAKSRTHGILLG